MKLNDLIQRNLNPIPWVEGEKIPWNEPAFSARMLKEHLTQKHDAASRRKSKIKKQVEWLDAFILAKKPARILDLGCGPGLYCSELAARGHSCRGIDFSPASIDYAVKNCPPNCAYTLGDLRNTDFGAGFDLVMFIFGEFNVFKRSDAQTILYKAYAALRPGGTLVLEVSTEDAIYDTGHQPSVWYSSPSGLFSPKPHLCLMETFWDDKLSAATERYLIVDTESGEVTHYSSSSQAYSDDDYRALLGEPGFREISIYPSLTGKDNEIQEGMQVLVAHK